jgi:DNA mismatch endonuclease (patch repair protein)
MMANIRAKDTAPEMLIRRGLHSRGFRFRLHAADLPGKPDLVFPGRQAVIFVHGCFWHGHDCHMFKWPASRVEFWREKIQRNMSRDQAAVEALLVSGWRVLTVWECALKGRERRPFTDVLEGVVDWLSSGGPPITISGKQGNGAD